MVKTVGAFADGGPFMTRDAKQAVFRLQTAATLPDIPRRPKTANAPRLLPGLLLCLGSGLQPRDSRAAQAAIGATRLWQRHRLRLQHLPTHRHIPIRPVVQKEAIEPLGQRRLLRRSGKTQSLTRTYATKGGQYKKRAARVGGGRVGQGHFIS